MNVPPAELVLVVFLVVAKICVKNLFSASEHFDLTSNDSFLVYKLEILQTFYEKETVAISYSEAPQTPLSASHVVTNINKYLSRARELL